MMKSVLFSLLLSLPANAVIPAEFQQLFERAHYQQLLADIAAQPNARQDPDLMLLQAVLVDEFKHEPERLDSIMGRLGQIKRPAQLSA
jgi:hypothetical protein